nr:hypothetical protein [Motilimonas eburnea]
MLNDAQNAYARRAFAESNGQRLLVISTALAPFRVGDYATKLLPTTIVLYKYPTNRCKNKLQRSAGPSHLDH